MILFSLFSLFILQILSPHVIIFQPSFLISFILLIFLSLKEFTNFIFFNYYCERALIKDSFLKHVLPLKFFIKVRVNHPGKDLAHWQHNFNLHAPPDNIAFLSPMGKHYWILLITSLLYFVYS